MMRLLHWVIASRDNLPEFPEAWGTPPEEVADAGGGLFSVLWSDVGEEFYRSAGPGSEGDGWEKRELVSTVWEVGAEEGDDEGWKWLTQEQLKGLWYHDAGLIRKELENMPVKNGLCEVERPTALVTCLPTNGVAAFQIPRATYTSNFSMAGGLWGVQSLSNPDTYASWSVEMQPSPPMLIVTRLRASEDTFAGLITKIKQVARRSGIRKVELWNLQVGLRDVAEKMGGRTSIQSEHLPQIMWYGPGTTKNVEWVHNEKFCWC